MGTEIERKFLVKSETWQHSVTSSSAFVQGYLASSEAASVRIRIIDGERGRITIKSAKSKLTRAEYEYDLPLRDALELIQMCGSNLIHKRRYEVHSAADTWVVDVFSGRHEGLVVAEIELSDTGQAIELPEWIGKEVTGDPGYSNAALARAG